MPPPGAGAPPPPGWMPPPGPMGPYPPGMGMMPGSFPPPQMPRRGGAGRAVGLTLLVIVLLLSLGLNLISLLGSVGDPGGAIQTTLTSGSADQKVAVVPLYGVIEANVAAEFDRFMDLAEKDGNVKAVVVEIDSPGGTVTASDEIHRRILEFKKTKKVPVVVSMGSMATSGGYYTACGGDHIFAQPTTLTGNIGVLMPRFNFSKLFEKYGVEESTIVSKGSAFKNAGSSYSKETPEERQYLQSLTDELFAQFKDVVSNSRGTKLKSPIDQIANGKVYTAQSALNLGLIDQIGYAEDAYAHAATAASLSNPLVTRYQNPPTLMDMLMSGKSNVGGGSASAAGGVSIHVDAKLLDELTTPRPLYLWRGQ